MSSWVERTAIEAADAVIAVSSGMRHDVLRTYPALDPGRVHVVRNGIDTDVWYPTPPADTDSVLAELGVDLSRPIVAFVGRITRQKGVAHLVAAAHRFSPEVQLVLCAGAPDTPRSPPRCPRRWPSWRGPALACSGCARCCRSTRFAKYSPLQQFLYALRCMSRWVS